MGSLGSSAITPSPPSSTATTSAGDRTLHTAVAGGRAQRPHPLDRVRERGLSTLLRRASSARSVAPTPGSITLPRRGRPPRRCNRLSVRGLVERTPRELVGLR